MKRFSTRDLLVATTLVAIGLGIASLFGKLSVNDRSLLIYGPYVGGCMLAGVGALYPFGKPVEGAKIGIIIGILCSTFFNLFRHT